MLWPCNRQKRKHEMCSTSVDHVYAAARLRQVLCSKEVQQVSERLTTLMRDAGGHVKNIQPRQSLPDHQEPLGPMPATAEKVSCVFHRSSLHLHRQHDGLNQNMELLLGLSVATVLS